ncbi:MAG TPA: cupin domain-containing protein [Candidatus Acidoferrales bacterium]|nr:cupin domain-containing protein [Candidatus Acidoferrales bacterium]
MPGPTTYESWIQSEGIPVVEGFGVEDLMEIPRESWPRTGGKGAFIQLRGMEGFSGMYVGEISPGSSLIPEKHLYDELIYILRGRGATEVWWDGEAKKTSFEWEAGALFAVPLNSKHRLLNGSREPVVYLGVTSAPLLMDLTHDPEFIFNCSYAFRGRFDGAQDYFVPRTDRNESGGFWVWESNFIPDVSAAALDSAERKGSGVRITALEMGGSALVGHIAEWPVGRYHKAHHHQGGAILLILRSKGYTLLWPQEAGIQPYRAGRADRVVRVEWKAGSLVSPPTGWFHQHFNTGPEPARQLAFRYTGNSGRYRLGVARALNKAGGAGIRLSVRDGGTLIEYEDEDPQIRRDYEAAVAAEGVKMQMPSVVRRTDTYQPLGAL